MTPEIPFSPERKPTPASILAACRENEDLYTSPTGLEVNVDNKNWRVTYWPGWTDRDGKHDERLSLTEGTPDDDYVASYILYPDGTFHKNDVILWRSATGMLFGPDDDEPVDDADIPMLAAIVDTAHEICRG